MQKFGREASSFRLRNNRPSDNRDQIRNDYRAPSRNMDLEYVFGAQPVAEALRANRRKFKTLYLRSGDLDNAKLLRSERYAICVL